MKEHETEQRVWNVTVDNSGRVLLPLHLRNELNAPSGTELLWVKDDAGVRLTTFEDTIAGIQVYYQSLAPPDVSWTDELLQERRRDAEHD